MFTGFLGGGLALIAMAVAVAYGTGFVPSGRSDGGHKQWTMIPIESPVVKLISVVCLGVAGAVSVWLAYKELSSEQDTRVKRTAK